MPIFSRSQTSRSRRVTNLFSRLFSRVYHYDTLEDDHIRILILEPGVLDAPLAGRLEQVKLQDANDLYSFEAISYAWGSANRDRPISMDGKCLKITTSLADCLWQARDPHRAVALWADGICINQEDEKEKSRQVALMGRIYESSQCTLICLGPASDAEVRQCASDVAGLIAEVGTMMDGVFQDPEFSWDWDSFPYPSADDALLRDCRWDSWDCLIGQPWFKRGWVVQEAALGADALVLWAEETIRLVSVLGVDLWLSRRARPIMPTLASAAISDLHWDLYKYQHPEEVRTFWASHATFHVEPRPLLETLDYARSLLLSDPKDRIYAFMALRTSDNAMPALQPDYRKDVSHLDVFRDFAIKYLEKTSDLNILRYVEYDDEGVENRPHSVAVADADIRSFPSWVPRWDRGWGFYKFADEGDRKITCDEGENNNPRGFSISIEEANRVLRVKAIVIDTVKYVSNPIENCTGLPERAVTQLLSLWRNVASQTGKDAGPYRGRSSMAFFNALNAGTYYGDRDKYHRDLHATARRLQSDQPSHPVETYVQDTAVQRISMVASYASVERRFLLLDRGYYGLAPRITREDDLCAIIFGTRTPFILRGVPGNPSHFSVVGPAFVLSKTIDEASGTPYRLGRYEDCCDWEDWDLQPEEITLV